MPVEPSTLASGGLSVAGWVADTYFGDGAVEVHTQQASVFRWRCEDNPQFEAACPFRPVTVPIKGYRTTTYAFTKAIGYASQSFHIALRARVNGCDVRGAVVYVTGYDESTFGRTTTWKIRAVAKDSPDTGTSGCDCCTKSASVSFLVTVEAPGSLWTHEVTLFGDGSYQVVNL